jgi:recombination associated protein RdgC
MFKSAIVYRIAPGWEPPTVSALEEVLERARFERCGPAEPRSAGWVEPRAEENGPLLEVVDGHWLLCLRTETRAVPGAAVRDALDERLQKIERDTGSRPRGKERKALKEEIVIDLLPRAFSKLVSTRIWIDPRARLMVVGAGSQARADEAVGALMEALKALGMVLPASLLKTAMAPSTAMSIWLSEREAPAGFSVDRDCELKQAGAGESALAREGAAPAQPADKATVRYVRHPLDIDEIVEHIAQGKVATKLALTWQDRVSFVLDSSMAIKRLDILDVVLEGAAGTSSVDDAANDGFEADVAITTGELSRLIPDLAEALGGEIEPEPVVAAGASTPMGAASASTPSAPQ